MDESESGQFSESEAEEDENPWRNEYLHGADLIQNMSGNSESSESSEGIAMGGVCDVDSDAFLQFVVCWLCQLAGCFCLVTVGELTQMPLVMMLELTVERLNHAAKIEAVRIGNLMDINIKQAMELQQLKISSGRMESAMQQLSAALTHHNQELLDLLHCQDQQIGDLTAELYQQRWEKEVAETAYQQLESNLEIEKERNSGLKDQNYQCTNSIRVFEETVSTLTKDKEELTLQIKEQKETNAQLVQTSELQKQIVADISKQVKQLAERGAMVELQKGKITELNSRTSPLNSRLEEERQIRIDLESQVACLKSAINDMACELNQVQNNTQKKAVQLPQEASEDQDVEKQKDELIQRLRVELEQTRVELEQTKSNLSIAWSGEDDLRQQIKDLTEQFQPVAREKREKEKKDIAVREHHERNYSPQQIDRGSPLQHSDSGLLTSGSMSKSDQITFCT